MLRKFVLIVTVLSFGTTLYKEQIFLDRLESMNNGASITNDIQSYIKSMLANAHSLFGSNLPSTAIYLTNNLNKAYNGTWSVFISNHLNSVSIIGNVMFSLNNSWWAVWSGQNPALKNTSYFISKMEFSDSYKYIQVGSGGHINGSGLEQDEVNRLYDLVKGKPQNFQLKANQVNQIASTIVNCNWNTFFHQFMGLSPDFAGYIATSEERYIHGRVDAKEGKDAYYYNQTQTSNPLNQKS